LEQIGSGKRDKAYTPSTETVVIVGAQPILQPQFDHKTSVDLIQ